MTFNEYKKLILSDLHRYNPNEDHLLKHFLIIPGFKYTFWMRTACYLKGQNGLLYFLYLLIRLILFRCEYKFGISIPYNANIGPGLYIGHFGGIVVSVDAVVGKNCNINHGVTIGTAYGGKRPGTPTLMDNIYLGPGSKIIGGITLGNNVAVGANAVVRASIPDNAIAVGIPAKVISFNGSSSYCINKV